MPSTNRNGITRKKIKSKQKKLVIQNVKSQSKKMITQEIGFQGIRLFCIPNKKRRYQLFRSIYQSIVFEKLEAS